MANGNGRRMARFNSSIIIYIVLAVILVTLLYFSWSLSSEVKGFKADKKSLQSELNHNEGELQKLRNQARTLTEELQRANEAKNAADSEKEKLTSDLSEAKSSLVSANTKLTAATSSIAQLQEQLDSKTEEVTKLTQERQSDSDNCEKIKQKYSDQKETLQTCQDDLQSSHDDLKQERKKCNDLVLDKTSLSSQYSEQGDRLQAVQSELHKCQRLLQRKGHIGNGNQIGKDKKHLVEERRGETRHTFTEHQQSPSERNGNRQHFGAEEHGDRQGLGEQEHGDTDALTEHRSNQQSLSELDGDKAQQHTSDENTKDEEQQQTDSPNKDEPAAHVNKDEEVDEGQGGQPMLGVGGEEEKQGEPQNPDLVLGEQNQKTANAERLSEKLGGVGTEQSPQLRGKEQAPDYHNDNDQGQQPQAKDGEDDESKLLTDLGNNDSPQETDSKQQQMVDEANDDHLDHIADLVSQEKQPNQVQYAAQDDDKKILKRDVDGQKEDGLTHDDSKPENQEHLNGEYLDLVRRHGDKMTEDDFHALLMNRARQDGPHHNLEEMLGRKKLRGGFNRRGNQDSDNRWEGAKDHFGGEGDERQLEQPMQVLERMRMNNQQRRKNRPRNHRDVL